MPEYLLASFAKIWVTGYGSYRVLGAYMSSIYAFMYSRYYQFVLVGQYG